MHSINQQIDGLKIGNVIYILTCLYDLPQSHTYAVMRNDPLVIKFMILHSRIPPIYLDITETFIKITRTTA